MHLDVALSIQTPLTRSLTWKYCCSCDLVVNQEVPGALMAQIWRNNTNRAIFRGAIIFLKETVTWANRPALVFEPNSDYYSNQSMSRI